MADYKFTQESGSNWKVNTANKADAMEDCNELRAIVDELGGLLVHSLKDGSFPKDLVSGGTLQIPADLVEISEIGTATHDDVQDWLNNTQSGGRISGFTITDDTSGGIAISSGTGFIKSTGDIGLTKSFDLAADAIVGGDLTDNATNYIYVDYNSGSPQILATNDRTGISLQDQFTLGRVHKSSGDIHIINSGVNLYNAVRRMHEVKIEVNGFQRASGGVMSESATTERNLAVTAGIFFLGDTEIVTSSQNTSGDYFTYHYHSTGGDWISSTGQTEINNTQYDTTTTGLTILTTNRYGVHWGYIHYDSDIHIVYGQGDYTLAQAEDAMIPDSLPSDVEDFGILASKIIIRKNSTGLKSIVTAYKTQFPVSSPDEHNDLSGLNTADYQHLTQAQYDEITEWAGAVTLSTGGSMTFSTGETINIDEIKAVSSGGLALYEDGGAGIFIADGGNITFSTGNISILGGQITFPASPNPSGDVHTLDDYEEGTYTPTLTCSASGGYVLNASFDTLAYVKIGRKVHIQGQIVVASEDSPDGTLRLSIPFAVKDLAERSDFASGSLRIVDHGGDIPNPYVIATDTNSYATFSKLSDAGVGATITHGDVDTAFSFYISFTYLSD